MTGEEGFDCACFDAKYILQEVGEWWCGFNRFVSLSTGPPILCSELENLLRKTLATLEIQIIG